MATISKVTIANLALSQLGTRSSIESLTENSREAQSADLWYEITRRILLERHDWGFARTRKALAVDDEAAPSGVWGYRYIYPADCLKARHLEHPRYRTSRGYPYITTERITTDQIPFQIEESPDGVHRTLLTDLDDATLIYTRDLDDPTRYPQSFVMLLAVSLAANMAYDITNKTQVAELFGARAERLFQQVAAHDANEEDPDVDPDADWIKGRY